jgi:DNA-directed RNA polymerase subunit RPC12/RpoP
VRARRYCPSCLKSRDHAESEAGEFSCSRCGEPYSVQFETAAPIGPIERCAFCGNRAFFRQKDFDQRIGCALMAISLGFALFAGWRFGWIWFTPVLLATVIVDWVVARRIRPVTICYRCDAEYRDLPSNVRHRGYDPHVAERYAKTKTVRRMR